MADTGKMMHFTKMQGCGNDYIYFDCFEREVTDPQALSIRLSDRRFGVGGDGIVLICRSERADCKMRMFNADGSEGKMCGNAIRCVGKFLYERRGVKKDELTVETASGIKTLRLSVVDGAVSLIGVDMGAPVLNPALIPAALAGDRIVGRDVRIGEERERITCISMGNPHCVVFKKDVDSLDLEKIGPVFEHAPIFPERVNTEFAELWDERTIKMRVWERGSGETWACGTGASAVAVAAVLNGYCRENTDITVKLRGGDLTVRYTGKTVLMTGPAEFVFEGECRA